VKHDGWEPLDGIQRGWRTLYFTGWSTLVPLNDVFEHHVDNLSCPCNPFWDTRTRILMHHAFDGRDLIERIEAGKIPL